MKKAMDLKESRLILWEELAEGTVDVSKFRTCSAAEVASEFNAWLDENPLLRIVMLRLDLSEKKLACLPPEIKKFTQLKELSFAGNRFQKFPMEVLHFTDLRRLYLSRNHLRELPTEILGLTKLEQLDLRGNCLRKLPPQIGDLRLQTNARHYLGEYQALAPSSFYRERPIMYSESRLRHREEEAEGSSSSTGESEVRPYPPLSIGSALIEVGKNLVLAQLFTLLSTSFLAYTLASMREES